MKDLNCIEMLRAKNQEGIKVLSEKYGPLIRYIITPILSDYREQEECFSDVLFRVWEKIDTFDDSKASFNTWLTTITRNIAINRTRKINTQGNFQELSVDMVSEIPGPEEEVIHKEQLITLSKLLESLSEKEKILVYRKYYYMQSTEQIAAEMGFTYRAVEGKLYRIKKKLRGLCNE